LKNQMRMVFNCVRWELVPYQLNPMSLVRVKDVSKRLRQPTVLTIEQFRGVLEHIPEPYRTCVLWPGVWDCGSVRFSGCSGATLIGRSTRCRFAARGCAVELTNRRLRIRGDRCRSISHWKKYCASIGRHADSLSRRVHGSSPVAVQRGRCILGPRSVAGCSPQGGKSG